MRWIYIVGHMDSTIEVSVFVQFRLSDQLRSNADSTNDFCVINVADPEIWLFRRF
ncbi:hypothetical protein MTR_5g022660 [Medicago truncatula]|uniref:Uncharacterized protein n=1 Tax=Medicago truncatula TaxID=3880 RepID=G7JXK7_MEDTR|nr:hypothetical protein MTR_5g022660 [Medicago truncatula]